MIGVFDSGVGGLTVVRQIKRFAPNAPIIYFADSANLPYGNKSKEKVIEYSAKIIEFLIGKGAKLIVIACHTASVSAGDEMRKLFPDVPIIDMIHPGTEHVISVTKNNKIGIVGTRRTIEEGVHKKQLLEQDNTLKVFEQACPLFVPIVEEDKGNTAETKEIITQYLESIKDAGVDTLVLGCTHYQLIEKQIQSYLGDSVAIVDPSVPVGKAVKEYIDTYPELKTNQRDQFYASDITSQMELFAEQIYNKKIKFTKVHV